MKRSLSDQALHTKADKHSHSASSSGLTPGGAVRTLASSKEGMGGFAAFADGKGATARFSGPVAWR